MSDKPTEPPKPDWALTRRERKAKQAIEDGRKPPRRKWPWVILLLVAGGFGLYTANERGLIDLPTGDMTGEASAAPAAEDAEVPVEETEPAEERIVQLLPSEIAEIEVGTLRETVRITGSLAPNRQLAISAEVSGHVDEVTRRAGEDVTEGDVLIRIGLETLRNQLEQSQATADATRAQLEFAQGELERTQSLVDRGVATSSTLDSNVSNVQQLQSNLAALERQVDTAEQSLEKATITAPFSGVVSSLDVDPGAFVSTGAPLLSIVDISSLELEGAVPVFYAPRVRTGQTVEILVDGFGDDSFEGKVERVSPVAASGTRMLPIFAAISNPDGVLRGGMFASGELQLDRKDDVIGVPVEAIREDAEGNSFVLKIVDEIAVRQDITIARMWDRGRVAEISEGLEPGDTIVAVAFERLQPDTKVTLTGE
ncbi:efflux RND transporter periplasmic adaptor subunit [Pelagovum pacificum]|uniref:Efflux RND transporter periplasmic adaptor subunit n=1 Tax=Pelagovum pacificum TaxID=2588711 RepID=A0A5C5GAF4_9RHOB|nr:efflux RND transporter periplasmic adaptor subunit [Pelagovum pacificum]QQA41712.1 efflux RND transporter periplasmic adaptor subunit [Pelagovum pacificum]TNY30988.1 efflux RND transporter periplasmic adaptor subunit [Pelagovum pacificum]